MFFITKSTDFYIFNQKLNYTQGKHRIGKTLPAHPNGWFVVLRSHEIKIGETKYVDSHGESLAVFRGNNGKVYVLNAYCPHLGANLGIGGTVIHDSCIKCPFHGWTFDGETGNCVIGKDLKPKQGISYEYEWNKEGNQCEFKEKEVENITVKKYLTRELNGFIHVWFHSDEKALPPYEPLDISDFITRLDHRGVSKKHCQHTHLRHDRKRR